MKPIKIGTRSSKLAMWQAKKVQYELQKLSLESEIITIDSSADTDLDKPLYEFGITGVFTKNLDIALLNKDIDIAVHSLKDVPTILPKGIAQIACLERDDPSDVLVMRDDHVLLEIPTENSIATGSLRRRAFWKNKYPEAKLHPFRGNIHTRLDKLKESDWDGAILSLCGLQRMEIRPPMTKLSFMIPAPAQGTIGVFALEENTELNKVIRKITHENTEICTKIERDFLNLLEGGCTAPIGAIASFAQGKISVKTALLSEDGTQKIEADGEYSLSQIETIAQELAKTIKEKGGDSILEALKNKKDE